MDRRPPNLTERLGRRKDLDVDTLFDLFVAWVGDLGLELYPAQEEAILELFSDRHVILKTPTGSGKSLVATALHFLALARGKRAVYTSPIKALVNEKFLELCAVFGPSSVGMSTGDSSVNRDAPILCCTAEILANMALAAGKDASAHHVVMDEFHYYSDRERGVAWQVPLLLLSDATFLLMSATLGDTRAIEDHLKQLTGRVAVSIASDRRPVPLSFVYAETPLHETIEALCKKEKAPVYLVNFTQREAADEAQNLMSQDFTPKETKKLIGDALRDFRFDTPYGKDMQRFLRHGVGLHHGGLLPKYRLLVEKLSRQGLLRVIAGTDTLGVGVNIPIRTVLFTKLCKFDGTKTRLLSVRDFRQIAGRAGRKGFDDEGFVVAQAPEHVIENKRMELRAAASLAAGKKMKVVKKPPPERGFVAWSEETFATLQIAQPEPLESRFTVSHGMLVHLMQRPDNPYVPGGGYRRLLELISLSHERDHDKRLLRRRARLLFQSLVRAGLLELRDAEYFRGREVTVREDLQTDFSLMQALSLFLVEALEVLEPTRPEHALDVLSFCESILETPRAILERQLDVLKREALGAMKAEGVEYEERMRRLEEIDVPRPCAPLLEELFERFTIAHPWVGRDNIAPKSIMRDMYERYMTFNDYVKALGLERIEGTLLRYLSDGFRTLVHTVPRARWTDEIVDMMAFFRTVLARADASLIQEWERLMYGEVRTETPELAAPLDITRDKRAFLARVRTELHALVKALADEDWEEAARSVRQDPDDPWTPERFAAALAPFLEAHDRLCFDHHARMTDKTLVREDGRHVFAVQQILVDPAGDLDWGLDGVIDLRADQAPDGPLFTLRQIHG